MCQPPPAAAGKPLELADVFRAYAEAYRTTHSLSLQQQRVMDAISACRTAALGGHAERCDHCGAVSYRYHSCRNRHCPKCQTLAKERWLTARQAELLPVPYFHVVFTLPHALNPLAQGNPRTLYHLLCRAAADTLLTFGRDPKRLGGQLGIIVVLHTWGQNLSQHLHVHCLCTGGALASGGQRWFARSTGFLFPVKALSRVFRAKYLDGLKHAHAAGELCFARSTAALAKVSAFKTFLQTLRQHDWVVYAKRPLAGPEQVLNYLGRYTHRIALTNDRLVSLEPAQVRFRWKDYAHGNQRKIMALPTEEFMRRFLLHVLPHGLMRIRHYGVFANRGRRERLAQCRTLLDQPAPVHGEPETLEAFWRRVANLDIHQCRACRTGRLHVIARLQPTHKSYAIPMSTGPPTL
jgi:hypothetical protein